MNKKTLKSALKFWQEIVFLIIFGSLLIYDALNTTVVFQTIGGIVISCIFLALFICLVGQFFWKNLILGIYLAVLLGLGSFYMTLAAMSDLPKLINVEAVYIQFLGFSFSELTFTWIALCFFVGLMVIAISMPRKYLSKVATNEDTNNTTSQNET